MFIMWVKDYNRIWAVFVINKNLNRILFLVPNYLDTIYR